MHWNEKYLLSLVLVATVHKTIPVSSNATPALGCQASTPSPLADNNASAPSAQKLEPSQEAAKTLQLVCESIPPSPQPPQPAPPVAAPTSLGPNAQAQGPDAAAGYPRVGPPGYPYGGGPPPAQISSQNGLPSQQGYSSNGGADFSPSKAYPPWNLPPSAYSPGAYNAAPPPTGLPGVPPAGVPLAQDHSNGSPQNSPTSSNKGDFFISFGGSWDVTKFLKHLRRDPVPLFPRGSLFQGQSPALVAPPPPPPLSPQQEHIKIYDVQPVRVVEQPPQKILEVVEREPCSSDTAVCSIQPYDEDVIALNTPRFPASEVLPGPAPLPFSSSSGGGGSAHFYRPSPGTNVYDTLSELPSQLDTETLQNLLLSQPLLPNPALLQPPPQQRVLPESTGGMWRPELIRKERRKARLTRIIQSLN